MTRPAPDMNGIARTIEGLRQQGDAYVADLLERAEALAAAVREKHEYRCYEKDCLMSAMLAAWDEAVKDTNG